MSILAISDEVQDALARAQPVVALETTIISHGLPAPDNIDAAREFEALVRAGGAIPATIGVIAGVPRIGLDDEALEIIATNPSVHKASVRELGILAATKGHGATTVAATALLAHQAGIAVFATGGLGGVHREASETFDESADLTVLSQSPVAGVCAGVKSVLDIPATLERLETLSVPVVGMGTRVFPAFWLPRSDYSLEWSVDHPRELADIMHHTWTLGHRSGIVVANPVPDDKAWNQADHDRIVQLAFHAAQREGIRGKDVTPFLLDFIQHTSEGVSLRVNLDVVRNNIRVATEIAQAWTELNS